MSQKSIINEVTVGGEEIFQVINAIEDVCEGVSKETLLIALLALAIQIQYPNVSTEDSVEGVNDVSKYICVWMDSKIDKDGTVN